MKSLAPILRLSTSALCSDVMTITGIRCLSASSRIHFRTSIPEMPGSRRSSITRDSVCLAEEMISIAFSPLSANRSSYSSSSMAPRSSRLMNSSSTIRTCRFPSLERNAPSKFGMSAAPPYLFRINPHFDSPILSQNCTSENYLYLGTYKSVKRKKTRGHISALRVCLYSLI